ncbi:DUF2267 domain-containing protein [Halosolutus amylolyticus]|uniref:DUF2267 domain-containing protein n=1 Tax=Halosolutus amylolyticus TaxID=2932267 RepID=A0ABD5PLJ8_9EURY|nr:DUF2267 domain-containing protein [Halosolutus amylolyticus]
MNFDEFTGTVQHRLELPDTGRTVRAIRATLMTLGQRLPEGNAADLAGSLPLEIRWYLTGAVQEHGQRFDWQEFVERVSEIEGVDPPEAAYHARVVVDLVETAVPPSDFQQLRDQLPESEGDENWRKLFEVVDAGGWGAAEEAQTGGGPQPEATGETDPESTDGGPE